MGKATKVVPYLMASGKVYEGSVILGFSTTTEDLDGDIVEQQTITQAFLDGEIDEAMLQFDRRDNANSSHVFGYKN